MNLYLRAQTFALLLFTILLLTACNESDNNIKTEQAEKRVPPKLSVNYPAKNVDTFSAGKGWKLVWRDEFNGTELNEKNWSRQVLLNPYNEEWEQYVDSKKNSYVKDGYLVLKAIHTSDVHADGNYTSSRLHTGGKQAWKYGKIVARIQLPHGNGIWPAFWMMGENSTEVGGSTRWPQCGEIDILELYGFKDDAVVEGNIHYHDNGHKMMGAKEYKKPTGKFADAFHTFEVEWDAKSIKWIVDGKRYHETPITKESMEEFHEKFYIILNIAVGGTWAGEPDNTTEFPQYMFVDWVRVYQK